MSDKKNAHLENWSFVFQAHWVHGHLSGKVSGHHKIEDGHEIVTSPIIDINFDENRAETLNTLYTLGEPDPKWLDWCDENGVDHSQIKSKRSIN